MKIKRIVNVVLSAMLAGTLLTGCGQDNNAATPQPTEKKLGMITHLNVNEKQYNDIMKKVEEEANIKLSHQIIFYDDLNNMQLALQSKSIDAMSVYKSVGNYITMKDTQTEVLPEKGLDLSDSFCCAVRAEDKELKASIDGAIRSMKEDGTLDKLIKEYITDLKSDPTPVAIEKIEGANTLKIAVTGDLPPLDLVLANGSPAGFNTAVLSEISKRIKQNVEIVRITSAARASALTSKQVDVVFWATQPVGDKIPSDIDKPNGLDLTAPYYQDEVVHIGLKK